MSFPYEGPSDALRLRMRPPVHKLERMEDLPMKQKAAVSNGSFPVAKQPVKKRTVAKRKSPVKRKPKPLPTLQGGEQPRDRLGRFARKTGQVLWGAAKVTGKAIKGTAKAIKRAHKTVKRVQANGRKRAALEHRERRLDLHKREQAAGLKRKKVVRKRVRR